MRIWDISPRRLCRQHLLGEHRELHAIWTILTNNRKGYRRHPEVLRWEGALAGLFRRHEALVAEMQRRGYTHRSPLNAKAATGVPRPQGFVDSPSRQLKILRDKGCSCRTLVRLG